jgi:DNA-directed RNA polymerase specialized sigma24 family protein
VSVSHRVVESIRTAFLIVGSTAEAEELVQDAFAQLHQRFAMVDTPARRREHRLTSGIP